MEVNPAIAIKIRSKVGNRNNIYATPAKANRIARQLRNREETDDDKTTMISLSGKDICHECGDRKDSTIQLVQIEPTVLAVLCHSCADDVADELETFADDNAGDGLAEWASSDE